ncbi:MAG: DUF6293 family protein [Archaeoglobaceae archaeon]
MKFVHVLPTCQNNDKILESIKKSVFPVQKVHLVICDDDLGEFKDMETTLRSVFEVETIDVRLLDIDAMVNKILRAINTEIDCGNMVFLNTTDSPEILNFAFHVSAQISGCKLYTGVPTKDKGVEVLDIPVKPRRLVEDDKLKIIKILHQAGDELESLDKLIHLFEVENMKGLSELRA